MDVTFPVTWEDKAASAYDKAGTVTVNGTANVLGKEIDVTVTRKKITVEHVSSKMVENNIAYLQVDSFDSGVAESFKKQVTELVNKGEK